MWWFPASTLIRSVLCIRALEYEGQAVASTLLSCQCHLGCLFAAVPKLLSACKLLQPFG
jgi:hypothetical protein